jgi:hypothetical protein
MKNWVLKEGKTFQFRWDAFNATNHPNFSTPSSNVTRLTMIRLNQIHLVFLVWSPARTHLASSKAVFA